MLLGSAPDAPIVTQVQTAEARRLRVATRTLKGLLALMVMAVAIPVFLFHTGFMATHDAPKSAYPRIYNYKMRPTPGQAGYHGIDFSQIWLSAQKLSAGEKVYYPVAKKRWRREWSSTYHPLIHWLYIPLGKLRFPVALVLHNLFGIGLLLGCSAIALRQAGCAAAFPSTAAVIAAAMYLTPTGLLHLERGQMDTYVAASILCLVALFRAGGWGWAVAAGILATLKVQAWIFVGLYSLVAAPLFGLRERSIWWVPISIAVATLLFTSQVIEWVPALLYVAENSSTHGATLVRILPKALAYAIPFVTTAAVAVACWLGLRRRGALGDLAARRALLMQISFPLAAALGIQTACSTDVTHDYRLVAFLGLLPALSIWCARAEGIPIQLRWASALGFAATLCVALRIPPFFEISYENAATLLLGASLAFALIAAYLGSEANARASGPDPA